MTEKNTVTASLDKSEAQTILRSVPYSRGFHFFTAVGNYTGETAIDLFAFYEELKAWSTEPGENIEAFQYLGISEYEYCVLMIKPSDFFQRIRNKKKMVKMLGMNVAIEETVDAEVKTSAGIVIPGTVAQGDLRLGKIIDAGDGEYQFGTFVHNPIKDFPLEVKVIFDRKMAKMIEIEGKKLLLVHAREILGYMP